MAEAWPELLRPSSAGFRPENVSRSGGAALNGQEQTVASLAGRWRASVTVPIRSDEQVLAARAFIGILEGRANAVLVPAFDGRRASWPVDAQGRLLHPGVTRRRRLDGTAYEDPAIPAESEIVAAVTADAALRAMALTVEVTQGGPFRPGQYLGIGERLYMVRRVLAADGAAQVLDVWPPLREAAEAGQVLSVTRPTCRMRLVSDDQGLGELADMKYGELGFDLREDV